MKRTLSFLLALCLGLSIPALAAELSDVPADHWAYQQVSRCVQDGIVSGYPDGAFKPTNPVSYGAFSIMLARAFYASELAGYSDQGTAAGEAIMNKHGILSGTSRSSASIGASLPREDMAQVMYNILVDKGAKIPTDTEYLQSMGSISDFQSINNNCHRAVMVCYTTGLLGGQSDGSFGPKNPMNRAQGCVVINRLRDYMGNTTEPPVDPVDPSEPPEVTDGPLFKMLDGENAQQMMDRINASTTYREGYLTNGKPITEENIKELLAKFEETMPHGTTWDESSTFNYQSQGLGWKIACGAFAAGISDALFDEKAPVVRHQNFDQLKVGDVVEMRNSKTGYKHGFVITSLTPPPGYYSDDYSSCSGNVNGKVSWTGHGAFSTFDKPEVASDTWIYSRY
ncbi:S-layer homology domain-containing protein [uncultured Oscillibacter sp.]|uniref:S-layer homology domain-containing protein n=1 Tax=uncultured Oscillibacter sp. TaxID=876091 RepID=UPI00261AA5E3|nr:S-layer homology domain-containing protein [uncultured Oscillibacter sp.]